MPLIIRNQHSLNRTFRKLLLALNINLERRKIFDIELRM